MLLLLLVSLVDAKPGSTAFEVVVVVIAVEEDVNAVDVVVATPVEVCDIDVEVDSTDVCTAVLD